MEEDQKTNEIPAGRAKPTVEVLFEHHRFYSNRHWQYFGAILLVNSLLYTAIKDLMGKPDLIIWVSFTSVIVIGIFYHMVNWTDMRIDDNMERVNALLDEPIPDHKKPWENTINWSKAGIFAITFPYFYLVYDKSDCFILIAGLPMVFVGIIMVSECTRRSFHKRNKAEQAANRLRKSSAVR